MIRPVSGREVLTVAQCKCGLQVSIWLLCGQNLRDPIGQRRFHSLLSFDNFLIALSIDHQCNADRFNRVINPGVGKYVASVTSVRLAGEFVGGVDQIVYAAFFQVRIGNLVDAVRNPVYDQGFGPTVPERIVDLIVLRID